MIRDEYLVAVMLMEPDWPAKKTFRMLVKVIITASVALLHHHNCC